MLEKKLQKHFLSSAFLLFVSILTLHHESQRVAHIWLWKDWRRKREDDKEWKWNLTNKKKLRSIKKQTEANYRTSGKFCFVFSLELVAFFWSSRVWQSVWGPFFLVSFNLISWQPLHLISTNPISICRIFSLVFFRNLFMTTHVEVDRREMTFKNFILHKSLDFFKKVF